MRSKILVFLYFPAQLVYGQIKNCYGYDGTLTTDFPCNPETNVSSCCLSGGRCATNLYIISPAGAAVVGTCTDRTWTDPQCPYKLNLGNVSLNFDHFSYKLNVTICDDSTVCPNPGNQTCCDKRQGRVEINYHNNAIVPSNVAGLSSYYALADYTIPASTSASTQSGSSSTQSPSSTLAGSFITITSTPTLVPTPKSSSSGLSPGGKAGLGAGVGVGLAVLGVLCWILYLLYRRHDRQRPWDRPELASSATRSNLRGEMSAEANPTEMEESHGATNVHHAQELSGSGVRR